MKKIISLQTGFTLLEVVAAIALSALAMLAMLPYFDRVFLLSHEPRVQLGEGMDLQAAMESLVAFHTNRLGELEMHIGPAGSTFYGGRFLVVDNQYVNFTSLGAEFTDATNTNLLKVTLENALGERLTRLFTEPL